MKRNQYHSFPPPQNLIEIFHNQDLLANYSSLHLNYNHVKFYSIDWRKDLLIFVKSRREHFVYNWISSCVNEARTEMGACAHGTFAKNQAWKYFPTKTSLKIWWVNLFSLKRYSKNNVRAMYCRNRNFFLSFQFSPNGKELRPWFLRGLEEEIRKHMVCFLTKKFQVWGSADAPLRTYNHMKNAFSIDPNRKNFRIVK